MMAQKIYVTTKPFLSKCWSIAGTSPGTPIPGHRGGLAVDGQVSVGRWLISMFIHPDWFRTLPIFSITPCETPSSALLPFGGGGFPYSNRLEKKGTLILTSLLEDLDTLIWIVALFWNLLKSTGLGKIHGDLTSEAGVLCLLAGGGSFFGVLQMRNQSKPHKKSTFLRQTQIKEVP